MTSVDEHGPRGRRRPRPPAPPSSRREPPRTQQPRNQPPRAQQPRPQQPRNQPRTQPPAERPARPARGRLPDIDPPTTPVVRSKTPSKTAPGTTAPSTTAPERGPAASRRPAQAAARPGNSRPRTLYHGPTPEELRRDAASRTGFRRCRHLGPALLTTLAATVLPGAGHLMLRRRRAGTAIVTGFVLGLVALLVTILRADRSDLLGTLLSSRALGVGAVGLLVAALAWMAVIVQTYLLARPPDLRTGQRLVGAGVVTVLCLSVAAPLGFGAEVANSQRQVLTKLFPALGGGTPADEAIGKGRLNVLLVGSDAGPDRRGTRTDTMMVASVDTRTGRTILFGLPRNIQRAVFSPGSAMAREFPDGFYDRRDPLSGDYLLNAVYGYGHTHPDLAPPGPTADPGLNLLHDTVETMLGLDLDYYVEVNMAGFASIIDALGGLTVDVGPEPLPVGGITPSGRLVKPDRYIPAGVQHLNGEDTLAVARSRTNTDDYARMGRQRCLLQYVLQQKSPVDVLTNFQSVAAATTNSVSTNIPQKVLPALVTVADSVGTVALESVSFDPNLADPGEPDGRFDTARPDVQLMRRVVRETINGPPAPTTAGPTTTAGAAPTSARRSAQAGLGDDETSNGDRPPPTRGATSLAQSC